MTANRQTKNFRPSQESDAMLEASLMALSEIQGLKDGIFAGDATDYSDITGEPFPVLTYWDGRRNRPYKFFVLMGDTFSHAFDMNQAAIIAAQWVGLDLLFYPVRKGGWFKCSYEFSQSGTLAPGAESLIADEYRIPQTQPEQAMTTNTSPRFDAAGNLYADFAAHWESRGYDFPCTSEQFRARVAEYAGDNQSLAEVLINQGGAT